jgi:multidrug efflux pump subunit AcrA (membrane-fusion protein)
MTPAAAIEAAELAEAETRYRNQLAREMAAAAFERGQLVGRVQAAADIKAVQHGLVLDAEMEGLRWGPGGRAHFADPRPGDFPGRAALRQAETEPELEAG